MSRKFYGPIGYGKTEQTTPGVWEDTVKEVKYYGDVVRNSRTLDHNDGVLPNIGVNNSISIVADAYAMQNFFAIKYVKWAGEYWIVSEVEVQRPRLLLRLGGVYNGPKGRS